MLKPEGVLLGLLRRLPADGPAGGADLPVREPAVAPFPLHAQTDCRREAARAVPMGGRSLRGGFPQTPPGVVRFTGFAGAYFSSRVSISSAKLQ